MKKFLFTHCGSRRPRRDRASTRSRPFRSLARSYQGAAHAAPLYNWTGFYIGGHVGGVFSSDSNFGGLTTGNNGNGCFLGGLQVGADYQFAPSWVVGVAEYSWTAGNNGSVIFPGGQTYTNNQRGLGSVTGRLGYTWGPGLLYVKGGYAFAVRTTTKSLAERRWCSACVRLLG